MIKACLVTGATGFIGQHLVSELITSGRKVIALGKDDEKCCFSVLKESPAKISMASVMTKDTFLKNNVQLYFGEISDSFFIKKVFTELTENNIELEYVIHLAACATIQQAAKEAEKTWKTNYEGTNNILNQCFMYQKQHPAVFKSFFHASTDKVYGEGSRQTYNETDILKPLNYPYDKSKAEADLLVQKKAKENNFPAVLYRFCNVYGPGDYHKSRIVPGTLYRLMYTSDVPLLKIYRDSYGIMKSFYRDMIYVKDLTRAVNLLLQYLDIKEHKLIGEVFNLGTGNSYAMNEIIEKINSYMNEKRNPLVEEVNSGEIKNQCMNYTKLNKMLGFSPKYDLSHGIEETVKWYLAHKEEINGQFS